MSLYNMLFGRNEYAPYLLAYLGITQETVEQWPLGRIRDVYTNPAGDRIFIFTRNGNYEEYKPVDEALAKHPNYVRKFLDDFDSTYATYEFTVPEEFKDHVLAIAHSADTTPPMVKFKQLLKDMEEGKDNHMTRHSKQVGKIMMEHIVGSQTDQMEVISNGLGQVVMTKFSTENG